MAKASERDRYEYGVCINRDIEGKPCPKCASKEVQKIRKSQDFICDECKEPLRRVPPPKPKPPWGIIIGIIVAAIIVCGFGAYMLFFKDCNGNGKVSDSVTKTVHPVAESDTGKTEPPVVPPLFTVNFNSNGGSDVASQTVKKGEKATRPANPTKTGNKFEGWFTDSELTSEWKFETEVTKNITLYAKWTGGSDPPPPCGKTKDYSTGKYEGALVQIGGNCIPHGQGTMTYKCRVQIAKMARTDYFAEKGYIFQGTWYNGDIEQGTLRDGNNNIIATISNGRRQSPYNLANDKCQ